MAMVKVSADIHALARIGARIRLRELDAQVAKIRAERQSLKGLVQAQAGVDGSDEAPVQRRRRRMSKAGRAAISAAQKARWAKVKAKNGHAHK
jgi:hypothetical protein